MEFVEEIHKDKLESFLFKVSRSYPDSKLGVVIIGLDSYLKRSKKRSAAGAVAAEVEGWMADVFVKYSGVTYHHVANTKEAAEHVVQMSHGFVRMMHNKNDVSYLTIFGGCKASEAISIVDLKLSAAAPQDDMCTKHIIEWINLLHAIPGIGPKDAHVTLNDVTSRARSLAMLV